MSPTLLLDLDNTLLRNKIDDFLPQYLKAFSSDIAGWMDPDLFVHSLMAGTQAMVRNRLPDCTLQEVFESVFFSLTRVDQDEFLLAAERFYQQVFPGLRRLTEPIPQSVDLVQEAARRGYQLAVTTNPLFPQSAVLQRLAWADLPADRYPFQLIASYEKFHFAKPDPAYLAEALGLLGWPPGPLVVVGDDFERDILPGKILGLPTYWVNSDADHKAVKPEARAGAGKIQDLLTWLDNTPLESLQPDFETAESCLAVLRATPAVLDSISRSFAVDMWARQPNAGEWSLTEILCHLRDVDQEVNLPRLVKVVESSNPFIPGEDTDPWAEKRQYSRQDGRQALSMFTVTRMKMVELLESLAPADWELPARHAIFGPTLLKELVKITAAHDRMHLQQIYSLQKRILAPLQP